MRNKFTLLFLLLFGTGSLYAQSDLCSGATAVSCGGTYTGNTSAFGADIAPFCGTGDGTGGGVWYSFTGTGGSITASLCGSSYDTKIRVFTGTCGSLTCVTGIDDFCGLQSQVTWTSTTGVTYYILVHGFGSSAGAYTMAITCAAPPSGEDACSGALTVSCGGSYSGNTGSYTADVAPFCGTGDGTGGGLWYQFVGTGTAVTASLCGSSYDTKIRVYSGTCASPVCVTGIDDFCGLQSEVTWSATLGVTYYILVHGFGASTGAYTLNITCLAPPGPEDNCAGAIPVVCGGSYSGNTSGYTADVAPTCTAADGTGGGVWYQIVGNSQNITASLCGSSFDTRIRVFTGTCGALTCVAGNEDFCGLQSQVTWTSTTGVTYYILVHGFGSSAGAYTMNVTCAPPPPPLCYNISSTPYLPNPYTGTAISLTDDVHSGVVPIGFSFCFNGSNYTQCVISSNNYITFDLTKASTYSSWVTVAIPSTTPAELLNTVQGPWQDINPGVGGMIYYQTIGTAPNRLFVVSYDNVPMFSCTGQLYRSQIVLREGSNCIETHIDTKPICTTWNNGNAVHGLQNSGGTSASVVAGRNNTQWTTTGEGTLFTPNCIPCMTATSSGCLSVILPLELLDLSVVANDYGNVVRWTTATESNTDYFIIERSDDGVTFETIGETDAAGNSAVPTSYIYSDNNPLEGINYYRLRMVDLNGSYTYSNTVSVLPADVLDITIYPNPADDQVTVQLNGISSDEYTIEIRDMLGRIVYKTNSSNLVHSLSTVDFPKGMYRVIINDGQVNRMKTFIKN